MLFRLLCPHIQSLQEHHQPPTPTCESFMQAGFTGKELRELLNMPGIAVHINPEQLENLSPQDQQELKGSRAKRRIFDLMAKASAAAQAGPW